MTLLQEIAEYKLRIAALERIIRVVNHWGHDAFHHDLTDEEMKIVDSLDGGTA